ncbi:AraC-like DNA-binding protein [Alteromonadaceae bacterium 2753L.S.0a.02]|nr:AraC-like DNA-binding protein [Alteromonadaceae bacterium 2753L.S.0a.02]
MMKLLSWSLSFATLALIAHLITHLVASFRKSGNAWFFVLFLSGCGAYIIHTFFNGQFLSQISVAPQASSETANDSRYDLLFSLFWLWAETTPWALWVFLHRVCRQYTLSLPLLITPLVVITTLNVYCLHRNFDAYPYLQISNFLNFLLLALAVHEVMFDLRADLSNRRRKFRNLVAIAIVSIVGLLFYVEVNRPTWTSDLGLLLSRSLSFATAFLISLAYFRAHQNSLTELFVIPTHSTESNETQLSEGAQQLLQAMQEEVLYTTASLSLSRLSEHLEIPEYRLRDIIKTELGFQNFNKFINRYRVDHAARALKNQPELSIAEIMHSSGFNSHPPFHRAFRDVYQCTPAEYRENNGTVTS